MNNLTAQAAYEIKVLNNCIYQLEVFMDKALPGSLKVDKKGKHIDYYQILPGTENKKIYISKNNIDKAMELAQKSYNRKVLKNLKARKKALEKMTSGYPKETLTEIFEHLSPERQTLVKPLVLTDSQFTALWMSRPYKGLKFREDDSSSHYTDRGERVRSKAEVIIANILYHAGIPYKYECPLELSEGTFYPDFTILDLKNRRVIYLEHAGMLDNPKYANDFVKKMNIYQLNGIHPGDNLLLTFETSEQTLNTLVLKMIIEHNLTDKKIVPDGTEGSSFNLH